MKAWLTARSVKELLALIALVASIVGAGILTANRVWLIKILADAKQWGKIGDLAYLDTLIIGAVLIGFGFAINKRSIKITKDGIDASGGE
jgi:hypothetical protein